MTWALTALAFGIPLYLVRFHLGPIPTTLWEIALWIVVIVALVRGEMRLTFWRKDPLRWGVLVLLLAGTIALFLSPSLTKGLGQFKAILIDPVIFYWLARSTLTANPQARLAVTWGLLLGGSLVALAAVNDFVAGMVTADGRVLGIYAADPGASPNYLGLYLGPLAALSFGLAVQARVWRQAVWPLAITLLLTAGVAVSQSRAAAGGIILAFVFGGATRLIEDWPYLRKTIVAVTAALIIVGGIIFAPKLLPDFQAPGIGGGRVTSSNNVRYQIWQTTIVTVLPRYGVFGLGWDNFQTVFSRLTQGRTNYKKYIDPLALHPHNFVLTTLVTLGVIGLIGWLIIARALWRVGWAAGLAVWLALLVWLIHGLVDTTFYKNDLAAEFFLLAALLFSWPVTKKIQST